MGQSGLASPRPCTTTDNEVDAVLNALGILAVVVLIAANGYFVAGEFAFVAARRSKFSETADTDRKSRRAVDVHKRLSFMLSGAQLGITVTTLVLGFIAAPAIAALIDPAADLRRPPRFGVVRRSRSRCRS